jgi:two-component system sensor histidine kinase KdpD
MNELNRPDPDELLRIVEQDRKGEHRGELKIFFGASAGVGKTYTMLQAAQSAYREGLDAVVGIVETHQRPDTEKILAGLPLLPRKIINHNNVTLKEFDLDAALARKPALILIDEMAHTNAPGLRHPKRWQDIEELLDAGIDVYTTLNVQHLESLNDVVTSITGIIVQETVPDSMFDAADDIQLVDVPTEDLLDRLREGNVYVAEGAADRAAQNFFSKTNLMSLRELALRRTADHVDLDTDDQRMRDGLFTPNVAGDKILVCIGQDELAAKLVRTTKRLASSLRAPWYALSIDPWFIDKESAGYKRRQRILRMAEQNGAIVTILEEEGVGDTILDFARNKAITKIVLGRSIRPFHESFFKKPLVEYIIQFSGDIDVYVITGYSKANQTTKKIAEIIRYRDYLSALASVAFITALGCPLRDILKPVDQSMFYLIIVALMASKYGKIPALFTTILSLACLNFFFIKPYYSFDMADRSYWITFVVMLVLAMIVSALSDQLRRQKNMAQQKEKYTQTFYALSKELAAVRTKQDVVRVTLQHFQEALKGRAYVWMKENGELKPVFTSETNLGGEVRENMAATWCFEHAQAAGMGTNTLPGSGSYFYPVQGAQEVLGVVSFTPLSLSKLQKEQLSDEEKTTIETFAHLLSSALDRIFAAKSAEELRVDTEAEKLKNTFLSSMSHDLRTPIATIRGSAELLLSSIGELAADKKQDLLRTIFSQSDRLSRIVNNLLDLTKYESGNLKINSQSYYLQELIGATLSHIETKLSGVKIVTDIPQGLPMVNVDGILIEQLLQNLLENAASFSPQGATITIRANHIGDEIQVSILDQGCGIAAGYETKIFDKFYTMQQLDRPKGAGLGLAICQAIVKAHGGRIWSENNPEGGANFSFMLPCATEKMDDIE